MNDKVVDQASKPCLCLYWYEMPAGKPLIWWWGQLAGAMHRLTAVQRDFLRLRAQRNVEKALLRLEFLTERYVLRAYELRERALGLLMSRIHRTNDVNRLRNPKQRCNALSRLKPFDPQLTVAIECLLLLLDDDIELRNLHTHNVYLSLGLDTGSDIFDPYDALVDVSNDPTSRRTLEALLRREVKRMARRYIKKTEALHKAIEEVLNVADHARKGSPDD
jgi:hypothetical protein